MGFFKPAGKGAPEGADADTFDEGEGAGDEDAPAHESAEVDAALGRIEEDAGLADPPAEL